MAQFETWLESDLKKPLKVVRLETGLFSQDNQGNLIGVTILSNGQTATVTGDVYGYVIRDDAETVVIPGTLTNNKASIVLPLSAYVVPGQVSIVIKVGATTVAACTGYVTRSMTDIIVDPAHVIPNLEELLEKIADMETATTAANTAAQYANEKGGLADEKATLANTKAGLADEKATLANQKAGLADQAATNANTVALKLGSMTVTITALDPGSQATAQMITDPETGDKTLALGIPRGEAFRIVKTYASIAAMEADFSGTDVHEGEYVAIVSNVQDPDNAKIYIKGSSAWGFVLDMSGTAGIQGEQGIQGIQGVQGVSITGGSASGESTAKMLTLTLYDPLTETSSSETISLGNIKGDQGIQGIQGIQGYQGVGIIGATASGGATGKILTLTLKNPANNTTAEVQVNLGDLQGEQGIQGYQGVGVANVSASGTAVSKVLTFELYNPASGGSSYANVDLGNIKGDKGDPGDATIDDTAGAGDTDKVWSADKTVKELNGKADMVTASDLPVVTQTHEQGDVFICNNQLIRAKTAIVTGETVDTGSGGNAEVISIVQLIQEAVASISGVAADVLGIDGRVGTLEKIEAMRGFTPAQLQKIVQDGLAAKYFSIGDEIVIPWTDNTPTTPVTYQYPFVVVHIGDVVDDQNVTHHNALWLMAKYATPQLLPFDAPEQIVATEETFQQDTYYYIKNGNSFEEQTVTPGATIPSGTTYYKHYRSHMSGVLRYGYNRYKDSAYRQWLNSNGGKGAWWTAQHPSDVAPEQAETVPGFLTGFTADWLSIFKPVEVKCYRNSDDGGGFDVMYDKFFLPGVEQMYGVPKETGEGVYWEYWKNVTGFNEPYNGTSSDTNDARYIPAINDIGGNAKSLRLRTVTSSANTTNISCMNGYITGVSASITKPSQPSCVIY